MKICLDCNYTAPAKNSMGAERMIEALAVALQDLGHTVVMHLKADSTSTPAPLVSEIPSDCDIINFNGWIPGESEIEYPKHNIPFVVTLHGGGTETDPTWLRTIKNPHMICVSKFIADRIGTKAYAWSCSNPNDLIFRDKKEDYFLWLAGTDWGEGKGLFSAIMLAKKLNLRLIVAGTGQNTSIISQIKNLCVGKIEYVGGVNGKEKAELLAGARAFLLLTQVPDACPLTFSEAMLSGTPVITTDKGAMPELVTKDVGIVCKTGMDLARAVTQIHKIDPNACRKYGLENLSGQATAKKYIQFYNNMVKYGNV
jgi:glycosyltransferase involved in cell wall biosynthesis